MDRLLSLELIGRYVGVRALAWADGVLYAGKSYELVAWSPDDPTWRPVAIYAPGPLARLSSSNHLMSRLARHGYHALAPLPDGGMVAVLRKVIARLEPGGRRLEPTFRVRRGTRPLSLAVTPAGEIFWGEYFSNRGREPVHVYGSSNGGRSWRAVHTFRAGTIRHVHSISYDPYDDCLWILTGDEGDECAILRAAADWSWVETVLRGSQQARAVTLLPLEDAIYFATDTPTDQNYAYRLDRDGGLERLAALPASSFWSCRVGHALFFSTGVEPSPVNAEEQATLYGSADGREWTCLIRWPGDPWPRRLFQYPNIILPTGESDGNVLAASGVAVQGQDQTTHLWRVVVDRRDHPIEARGESRRRTQEEPRGHVGADGFLR
ncbi:MAG: hypothetical protein ACE5JR_07235 [Gemmatimonadota bacterium]